MKNLTVKYIRTKGKKDDSNELDFDEIETTIYKHELWKLNCKYR